MNHFSSAGNSYPRGKTKTGKRARTTENLQSPETSTHKFIQHYQLNSTETKDHWDHKTAQRSYSQPYELKCDGTTKFCSVKANTGELQSEFQWNGIKF